MRERGCWDDDLHHIVGDRLVQAVTVISGISYYDIGWHAFHRGIGML